MIKYVVYIGDNYKDSKDTLKEAKVVFDSLPSGEGKRPGLRRSIVKEEIIKEDKR